MQRALHILKSVQQTGKHCGQVALGLTLVFALSCIAIPESAFAQHTVSGTVTGSTDGQPLPGVNVRVEGTQTGTATSADGRYELTVPDPEATLQFSFVGYQTQTIDIEGRSTINVTLEPKTLTGEELVVVGYSEERRADLTGSVQVVDTEELEQLPGGQITDKLQGNAAGVSVISSGQPGQDPQIRIRGINTFGNNTPLFVVDGVSTQSINNLNPSNIESIQVLKDASSASVYGARAANGVVIIETKQGEGDLSVSFSSSVGMSKQPEENNPWGMTDPKGRAQLKLLAACNSNRGVSNFTPSDPQYTFPEGCGGPAELPNFVLPAGADEANPDDYFVVPQYSGDLSPADFTQIVRANKSGTDWFDAINRTGITTNTNLSASGGGENSNYLLGLGYRKEEGTVKETFLERFSVRVNTTYNINDNIRVGENLSYTAEENFLTNELTEGSAIGMAMRMRPIIPVRDIKGNFGGTRGNGLGNAENPVAYRARTRNDENLSKRLFGNVFAEITFLEDFRFKSLVGGAIESSYSQTFQFPTYENSENNAINAHTEQAFNNYDWTWTNTVNYSSTLNDNHNVSALAGIEWKKDVDRWEFASVQEFFSFDQNFTNLGNGTGTKSVDSYKIITALSSQFGTLEYNYARRYFLSGTLRRDGSSRFVEGNRWGIFPAASAGWRVTEEPFMDGVLPWLTDLKIRGSWGIMGNQLNVNPNNAFTLFESQQFAYNLSGDNASTAQGFAASRIGNPDAQWEEQRNMNVGVDLVILDGTVEATVDYYVKKVDDLLFDPELPAPSGQAEQPFVNVASMENTGIDASVRSQTTIGDLRIDGSINFTSYNNEITKVSSRANSFSSESRRFNAANIVRNEVGHPVSSYFGYEVVGFFEPEDFNDTDGNGMITPADELKEDGPPAQTAAAPGRFRYKDVNGDGEITAEDRTFLGSPNPNFTAGLNLNFSYSNWNLSMSLYGSQGAEIWNQVKWWTDFFSSFNGGKSVEALEDSWQYGQDNSDATVPIQETQRTFSTNQVPNSYFVEDADYVRLQNLQLGYTVPSSLVQRFGIQQLRVYAQGNNLLTFTNYSNPDPEIGGSNAADATSYGIDEGSYPTPRQYRFGVDLTF
jgi:TonB-linked SusC/RagA family outer membrane protein